MSILSQFSHEVNDVVVEEGVCVGGPQVVDVVEAFVRNSVHSYEVWQLTSECQHILKNIQVVFYRFIVRSFMY